MLPERLRFFSFILQYLLNWIRIYSGGPLCLVLFPLGNPMWKFSKPSALLKAVQ